jgi:hypothetical protein
MDFIMTTGYILIFDRINLIISYLSCVLLRFALVELSSVLCSSLGRALIKLRFF